MIDQGNDLVKKIEQRESSPFERYIRNDLALMVVLLLIEFTKDDRKVVLFNEFLKFLNNKGLIDPDKFEGLVDYMNQAEFIMEIISELDFVKVDKVYFDEESCLTNLLKSLVREARSFPDHDSNAFIESFSFNVKHYCEIERNSSKLKSEFDRFVDYDIEDFYECFEVGFDKMDKYSLNDLLLYAGDSIAFSFSFDKKKASLFEEAFNGYFAKGFRDFYGQDASIFIEEKLADFKFINGTIRVPFELFYDKDFDVIAILKYLHITKQLFVRRWSVPDKFWEVRLLKKDLLSVFVPNPEAFLDTPISEKVNVSLDSKSKIVVVSDVTVDLKKAGFQFDLLEVLMKEKPIDFDLSFSEIAESLDHSYSDLSDDDQAKQCKRYSNAAFQLSRKVGFEVGIKDLLVMNRDGVRFNPKYKFRFIVR